MSIEDIKRRLQERAERLVREEVAKKKAEDETRLAKELVKRQEKEAKERRLQFIVSQTEKILTASGALKELQQIESDLLEHNVVKHLLNYSPKSGRAALAWGSNFLPTEEGWFTCKEGEEFSAIVLAVDPDRETLSVQGLTIKKFERGGWKNSREVEKAVDAAYLDPYRYYEPRSSSSGGDKYSGECCSCSGCAGV